MGEHAIREPKKSVDPAPARNKLPEPQSTFVPRRMTQLPDIVDLGEVVVGSVHTLDVGFVFNLAQDKGAARCTALIEGDGFTRAVAPSQLVESGQVGASQPAEPIRVIVAPSTKGSLEGRLHLKCEWSDGRAETQTVVMRVHARYIEDAPYGSACEPEQTAQPPAAEIEAPSGKLDGFLVGQFEGVASRARDAAQALGNERRTGVDTVYREVGTYRPPATARSLWWDLAEFALTLASAGIADAVAKTLVKLFSNVVVEGAPGFADSQLGKGVTSSVKEGLKLATKQAIAALPREDDHGTLSSDGVIAFFEMQSMAVNKLQKLNSLAIADAHDRLLNLLASNPAAAKQAMQAIGDALDAHSETAEQQQKAATAAQWVTYKTRLEQGVTRVNGTAVANIGPDRDIIEMLAGSGVLPDEPRTNPARAAGLVDINVEVDHGGVRVRQAFVQGIAQAVANEIDDVDLRVARVPLRLVVEANTPQPTIITVDEAGRVRVSGNFQRLARFAGDEQSVTDELQAERAARALSELVLSKTLAGWHVRLETDDRSAVRVPDEEEGP